MTTTEFESEIKFPDEPAEQTLADKLIDAHKTGFEEGLNQELGGIKEPEPEKPWTIDKAAFDDLVAKANSFDSLKVEFEDFKKTVNGGFAGTSKTIEEIRAQPKFQDRPLNITAETFSKLTEFFGDEDLAKALAEDLSKVPMAVTGSTFDQSDLDRRLQEAVETRVSKAEQDFNLRILEMQHPDWQQQVIAGTRTNEAGEKINVLNEDFETWRNSLTDKNLANTILSSNDGALLAKALTAFKGWKADKVSAEERKQQRLAAAIPASGNRGAATEAKNQDAFSQSQAETLRKLGLK